MSPTAMVVLSLLLMAACAAELEVEPAKSQASLVIDADSGGGDFCPSGRAKKGRS